mmetsp:Transcript_2104/g.3747  ORF Transcript_2104/g.3747 Transcript_2104/m.3747 type:complete len:216 (-) Transcript_2104:1548-2195(-)
MNNMQHVRARRTAREKSEISIMRNLSLSSSKETLLFLFLLVFIFLFFFVVVVIAPFFHAFYQCFTKVVSKDRSSNMLLGSSGDGRAKILDGSKESVFLLGLFLLFVVKFVFIFVFFFNATAGSSHGHACSSASGDATCSSSTFLLPIIIETGSICTLSVLAIICCISSVICRIFNHVSDIIVNHVTGIIGSISDISEAITIHPATNITTSTQSTG